MLYNNLATPDRSKTQLAQRIACFPWNTLSESARALIHSHHIKTFTAGEVELLIIGPEDETLRHGKHEYLVRWAYNCVPTRQEWENHKGRGGLVTVEFRASPAIEGYRVAILRFKHAVDSTNR